MHLPSLSRRDNLVTVDDYRSINLANWNSRVPHHEQGYALEPYRLDPEHLSGVVRFDLPRLGDVGGLDGIHLQCHIGTDTLSLARLGARMSGLDFSEPALEVARRLATDCDQQIDYRCSDVYDAVETFGSERFDFVYTGIGAICWLPSAERWARVVAELLRPGGFLLIREGHPMLLALCDPRPDGLVVVEFPYFENEGTVFVEEKSYVEHEGVLDSPTIVSFNHSLSEVFNALWAAGLTVTIFEEHMTVPWNQLGEAMVDTGDEEFALAHMPERLAATYTLRAEKR
jgi:SAM-dependent methyltransferase